MSTTPQSEGSGSSGSIQINNDIESEIIKIQKNDIKHSPQKALRFAALIVRCPCLLCISILILLAGITYLDGHYFVYTTDANRMYVVETNEYAQKQDALVLAQEYVAATSKLNESVTPQTQIEGFWTYQLMFKLHDESADNNFILTPENIQKIIEYEDKIYLSSSWQNKFCAVKENDTNNNYDFSCSTVSVQSIARDIAIAHNYNYSSMKQDDIKQYVLSEAVNPYYSVLFSPDINQTKESNIYRSIFHAALPIATGVDDDGAHISEFKNAEDRKDEQQDIYTEWAQELWNEITVKENGDFVDGNLEITALSYVVFAEYFIGLLSEAMFFVIFAIMAVYVYMSIHLRSCILSFAALIEILMSFPLAFFFYRLIFQVTHFDTFSSLIIFVLLGVGADDVFVFTDAWSQSVNFIDNTKENVLLQRMSFTYYRASKAMLITQLTTFFAFMATATSLIMPISAFGIWAGTIVLCNFMLVITLYPCILILHEKYLKKWETMICCGLCNIICKKNKNDSTVEQGDDYRAIEKFFGGKFTDFILKFRVYFLVFFALLYISCGVAAGVGLKANKGDEKWFQDDHFMQKVDDFANEFTSGETDGLVPVYVVWGINGVDRAGTSKWDSTDYGVVQWDTDFDFSSINGQTHIRQTCEDLKQSNLVFSEEVVQCGIGNAFEQYLESQNMTYPVSLSGDEEEQKAMFAELMYTFLHFSEYGEYIRNNALVHVEVNDNDEYEIKFVAIRVVSVVAFDSSHDEITAEFNGWNDWMAANIEECGDYSHCSSYHSSWEWAEFAIKEAFITSAIQGVLIAMPIAFIILLISTQNWIISTFAILDIVGIMLCELGLMAVMGWEFGISEAISTIMIIGFSVDYVVHLANAYLECSKEFNLRNERLRFALLTMGISVVSGAFTTFSAGFFLIFPVIVFFQKMGILMMSTIAFSIFFAMFFFTSILATFGPEYNTGNICCCFQKKKESQTASNGGDIEMR